MPAKPRIARPKRARERMQAPRLRPVQHRVSDLRDPRVRAAIRREARLLSKHPEEAAINDWIERVYDWDEWH